MPQYPYQPPQMVFQPPQPPPPPKPRPSWLTPLIVLPSALVAFLLGISVGNTTGYEAAAQEAAATPNPTVTVTEPGETVTLQPTQEAKPAPKPAPKPKPAKPKPKPATLVEGMNEIGVDAPAGRYKTTVPDSSSNCYWERDKDDKGGFSSIISNDNLDPGARGSVTVRAGQFFKSSGCGTWRRVQ